MSQGIRDILNNSNYEINTDSGNKRELNSTGFYALCPDRLKYLTEEVIKLGLNSETLSLDMGCGNGGFALMAAAVGFNSFDIDANSFLIDKARKNFRLAVEQDLVDSSTICKFAVGNMYPEYYLNAYEEYAKNLGNSYMESTPRKIKGEPYKELGIKISDFGIIYCFPWSEQRKFLTNFLASEARDNAILILPHRPTDTNFTYSDKLSVELKKVGDSIWKKIIK
ncbi:MAG: class I SAM-dependent methyltransferase [Nanoarchaeota archaeon]